MAIYGIGANYNGIDVSSDFIKNGIIGTGWRDYDAPDLHEYFRTLDPGDIVYIKSCSYSSNITIKGIGIVSDEKILTYTHTSSLIEIGRNVKWIDTSWLKVNRPALQKNNVRGNTIYREFHPELISVVTKIVNDYFTNNI
ncbi:hypothetical protein [Sphingobacterium daejeonense]|uniref:hypothetical protein n=1 Tax=Sphingobacterium daejeonense TaxID=371142 RepID=UPI003D3115CC